MFPDSAKGLTSGNSTPPISGLSAGAVVGWAGIAVGSIGADVGAAAPPQAAINMETTSSKPGKEIRW
jgi:hypothetical protein